MIAHEAHGVCWAACGPFGLMASDDLGTPFHLDLRLLMILGPRTLPLDARAAKLFGRK